MPRFVPDLVASRGRISPASLRQLIAEFAHPPVVTAPSPGSRSDELRAEVYGKSADSTCHRFSLLYAHIFTMWQHV